ncbi:MAG TPA: phosphoribosylformylglycinamidine synthase subunit PurS [bacterium]|nr:phosphoribosylformylglycinamidine synthase subunit PurS [bacterium]
MLFKATINATLRKSVLDPQGQTVLHALESLGFKDAKNVRMGKFFEITLNAESKTKAETAAREMCDKLLINPVIEEYSFEISE